MKAACSHVLFSALVVFGTSASGTTAPPVVLKRVLKSLPEADNLLRSDGWQPWSKGFTTRGEIIVCDNGSDARVQRGASQTVVLEQKTPLPILASASSRAFKVGGSRDREYSLYLDLLYTDGTPLWGQVSSFSVGTHDWQERRVLIVPEKPVRSVTVHLLLRRHTGKAWFRNARLEELKTPEGTLLFDGIPVTVSTSLPKRGFELRDVATESDYVQIPDNGQALGVQLRTRVTPGPAGVRFTDVTVRETSGRDRAVSLVFARKLGPGPVKWLQNPRTSLPVSPGREYTWTTPFHSGANGRLSRYPFAAVATPNGGMGLGIDAAFPAFFRVGFNSGVRQLFLIWDLGFTREKPEAHLRFCEFTFDPAWGFRSALARWYRVFPQYFRSRTPKQGLWMPFAKISKVKGWRDFGFKFKEGNNETQWDDAHGIVTFRYTEPMTWWMPLAKGRPRTPAAALEEVHRLAEKGKGLKRRQAQALLTSGMFDDTGGYAHLFRDTPWCNGVVWSMNSMPEIRGKITDFKLKWGPEVKARLYGPKRKGDLDGEYVDSSEGYVTTELDYRREHFAAAETPLVFSWETRKPAIFRGLVAFEYVRALARDIHGMGKLMMANSTPSRLCWLAPWLDVMGTETNWNPGGKWRPMSDAELLYRRSLCGPKPFCFLMNTDFTRFTHEAVEKYMKRAVSYGMFPGFFSADASTGHYFTRPELYNRDRMLFMKYIPLCKRLSEAGWQPVTEAWSDRKKVYVERFGKRLFTVYNDDKQPMTARITIAGVAQESSGRELISGRTVAWTAATAPDGGQAAACDLEIAPGGLAVLEVRP
ncbi:MAG: hypothetical protein GXP31_15080 [Kiritimatiellaeota bacterium]|nr:hypothetical protein [Kiritimatiellota bacterium]